MVTGTHVPPSKKTGNLFVAYSDETGASVGIEFSSTTQERATAIMAICASSFGDRSGKLVTSSTSSDTNLKTHGGGDDMETRIAVLEAEVDHIKNDVSEIKSSVSRLSDTVVSLDKNTAIIMEKLSTIKDSLDTKPSTDAVDKKISNAKLAILGGVPTIIAIGTAIYKIVMHYYFKS